MTLRAMTNGGTNMQNATDETDELFEAIGLDLDTERRSIVLAAFRPIDVEISAGGWRGPLHGVPVAVKDNYLTSDMPTRAGTSAPGIAFEPRDSSVVARLSAAGAVIIGKTRMHEFAWGNTTPPTRNPWDIARVPGGSSGGSGAAVAAGIVPIALGSDTG